MLVDVVCCAHLIQILMQYYAFIYICIFQVPESIMSIPRIGVFLDPAGMFWNINNDIAYFTTGNFLFAMGWYTDLVNIIYCTDVYRILKVRATVNVL